MNAHFLLSGSAALALVLAGCGGGDGSFSRSAADTAVDVTLRDFAFDGLPPSVSGRKLFVTATNAGPSQHEFEVLDAEGRSVDEIAAFDPGKRDARRPPRARHLHRPMRPHHARRQGPRRPGHEDVPRRALATT